MQERKPDQPVALEKLLVLPSSLLFLKKATMVWDESEDMRCGVGAKVAAGFSS